MTRWAILAGEYPPQPGGVSDYTRLVARELSAGGDAVRVFAPPSPAGVTSTAGPEVVRLSDHFGPRGLVALDRLLSAQRPDRILIQYVPHSFGWKAMNVPFAAWVATRARVLAPVWVMFHEVEFPLQWRPVRHALLGAVTRVMARLLVGSAARVFVSIPAWGETLRRLCPRAEPAEWLPVPAVVGAVADAEAVAAARRQFSSNAEVVGHFGTFGALIADMLEPTAVELLRRRPGARLLLIGRNSDQFRAHLSVASPEVSTRVTATGELNTHDIPAQLRACDVLLQPYPDGISSRRTSAMAGLANGVPVASNLGFLSEPLWATAGGVCLALRPSPTQIAAAVCDLLDLPPHERATKRRAAEEFYRSTFDIARTIIALQTPPCPVRSAY